MKSSPTRILWIALAEVLQRPGTKPLGASNKGACVNVLGMAANSVAFRRRVEKALSAIDLILINLEDVEPFRQRAGKYQVASTLKELARLARMDGQIKFGTFHTYPMKSNEPTGTTSCESEQFKQVTFPITSLAYKCTRGSTLPGSDQNV